VKQPIPVARLVEQVCDDGSDYDDGVMGYCSGRYDPKTGVLTLTFARDYEAAADEGDDWASAEYRLQLSVQES